MNKKKEYHTVVKFANQKFCTYHTVRDLIDFTNMLDKKETKWLFFNVYGKGDKSGKILASFQNGINNRNVPTTKWL